MHRLLRGVIDFGILTQEDLSQNFQRLQASGIAWTHAPDQRLYGLLGLCFTLGGRVPSGQALYDYYATLDDLESVGVIERLGIIQGTPAYTGNDYVKLLALCLEERNSMHAAMTIVEEANRRRMLVLFAETQEILQQRGVLAGLRHLQVHVQPMLEDEGLRKCPLRLTPRLLGRACARRGSGPSGRAIPWFFRRRTGAKSSNEPGQGRFSFPTSTTSKVGAVGC